MMFTILMWLGILWYGWQLLLFFITQLVLKSGIGSVNVTIGDAWERRWKASKQSEHVNIWWNLTFPVFMFYLRERERAEKGDV